MPHILYRPHIHRTEKIVTPDFMIRHVTMIHDKQTAHLPVDLCTVNVFLSANIDDSLIAQGVALISGQTEDYAAPIISLMSQTLYKISPIGAIANARVFLARQATALSNGKVSAGTIIIHHKQKLKKAEMHLHVGTISPLNKAGIVEVELSGEMPVTAHFSISALKRNLS